MQIKFAHAAVSGGAEKNFVIHIALFLPLLLTACCPVTATPTVLPSPTPPYTSDAARVIWDFFAEHPL